MLNQRGQDYIVQEYLMPAEWKLDRNDANRYHLTAGGQFLQKDEISVQVLLYENGCPYASFAGKL